MAAELTITAVTATTLALAGELDTHTSSQLDDHLRSVGDGQELMLDLSALTFISSAGLSVILNTQKRLQGSGGSLVVISPTPSVTRVIELSGLAATLGLS